MGSGTNDKGWSGLLIPDPRIEFWAAESTITQAGPRAGVPVPSGATRQGLGASGVQASAITVKTQNPGFPSRDAGTDPLTGLEFAQGGSAIWKKGSEAFRGHDPASLIDSWGAALWVDGSATPEVAHDPDIVALADGNLLIVAEVQDSGQSPANGVEVLTKVGITPWQRLRIYSDALGVRFRPCIVQLPSGRVHVYHAVIDNSSGTNRYQLRLWYSDDLLTWSFGGDVLDDAGLAVAPDKIRVAYGQGQVMVVFSTDGNTEVQRWVSSDLGLTFSKVETLVIGGPAPPYDTGLADVTFGPAGFVVALAGYTAATGLYTYVLADAYDLVESVRLAGNSVVAVGGVDETSDSLAICTDETGVLWAYGSNSDAQVLCGISYDGGLTWTSVYSPDADASVFVGTADKVTKLSCTAHRGRVAMAHQSTTAPTTFNDTIGVLYMGGWSSWPMPSHFRAMVDVTAVKWTDNWFPIDVAGGTSVWTAAGAGTDALASPGVMTLSCTVGQVRTWSRTPGATITEGIGCRFVCEAISGIITAARQSVSVRLDNGVAGYEVETHMGVASWRLFDVTAAAYIGGTFTFTSGARLEIQIWLAAGVVATAYRESDHSEDQLWIDGPSSNAVGNSAGAAGSNRIQWGQRVAAGPGTETSKWYEMHTTSASAAGQGLWDGRTEAGLRGRLWAGAPYLGEGVTAHAQGGPSWRGEQWAIAPRFDYGVERAIEDSSPRLTWRTTGLAGAALAMRWDDGIGADTAGDTGLLGIYIGGSNIPEVLVELYDTGVGWVSKGTADFTDGLAAMPVTITGGSVRPNGSGSDTPYLRHSEHAGGTAVFNSVKGRRISRHTEGAWRTGAGMRGTLVMTAPDGTEATPMTIIPQAGLILLDLEATTYTGVRLTIPTAASSLTPAEAYHELGTVLVGWVYPFGQRYSWGRATEIRTGSEVVESRDRQTASRVVAPPRRVVEISWQDGIDQTAVEALDAEPDTFTASTDASALPGASDVGTAMVLSGIIRDIDGGNRPVVYIEAGVKASGLRVLTRRSSAIVCRLGGTVRIESRQGAEQIDEVVNIATMTLTEEV